MYIGETSDTAPTARPPMNRAARKLGKSQAMAVATEVNANSMRDPQQHVTAAVAIAHSAGNGGAERAAEQQRAERDAQAEIAELEMPGQERARAADDGDVEPEQQAAGRGGAGEEQDVAQVHGSAYSLASFFNISPISGFDMNARHRSAACDGSRPSRRSAPG